MQDVYKNIEEYNLGKKRKLLLVFEDMIADMINNNLVGKYWYPGRSEDVPFQRPYEDLQNTQTCMSRKFF